MTKVTALHSGPLPSPEILRAYNEVIPGSAERILSMAESEQAHAHDMDKIVITKEYSDRRLGMWFGLVATGAFVLGALAALWLGAPWVSGLFVSASALGVIGAFINGRSQNSKPAPVKETDNNE